MDLRDELVGEGLPTARIGLLFGIVEFRPSRAAHDVNHAARLGLRSVGKSLVEPPLAGHLAFGARRRTVRLGSGNECERKAALIIVNMSSDTISTCPASKIGESGLICCSLKCSFDELNPG